MSAPARLGLYGLFLVLVFAVSALTAAALISDETVARWVAEGEADQHDETSSHEDDEDHGQGR